MRVPRRVRLRTALAAVALIALSLSAALPLSREFSASWHLAELDRLRSEANPSDRRAHERSHHHAQRYLALKHSWFALP